MGKGFHDLMCLMGPSILELLPLELRFYTGWVCKYTPVIPASRMWKQENGELEASLGYREGPFQKKKKKELLSQEL